MDINKEIQNTSDKIIAEKLPEIVEKATVKMLESIISEVFSTYGDMAKEIKSKIEEKLDINLQKFDTVDYNALVGQTINENLTQQVNLQPILDLTQNAIGFIEKKEIKLSEIFEMLIQAAMEEDNESDGEVTIIVEENTEHNWIEVALDLEENKEKHQCAIRFIFSSERNTIFSFHHQDYFTSQGKITPARIASLSILEHKIFRLYSAQVKIIADELNPETEWFRYD
jgi:hypothetical protein